MKAITFLFVSSLILSEYAFSQEYYEEDPTYYEESVLVDEGSIDSELQPPLADDYYLSEEIERQEEYPYPEESQEWSLEGEEIPVENYESY